jgi:alkyldihydroxyacetonephosphate synthase
MANKPYKGFSPAWIDRPAPQNSFRSIFRWGNPSYFKWPKETLFKAIKEKFNLTDEDFKHFDGDLGFGEVKYNVPSKIETRHLDTFMKIVGVDFVRTDDYSRLSVAYGKTMFDVLRIRQQIIENLPDVVLYPDDRDQIEQIVAYCAGEKIPVYVYGGGSSVTRGGECMKGGVSLDMRLRFNKVVAFNEIDQTITVQAGMSGPQLEAALNEAPQRFKAKRQYTCGHFPQSFEYSSVGGWVVTRGAGQNSTYYGKIEDLVLRQHYATPIGPIVTSPYPREATGPSLNHIMMGSEGSFGVLTDVTLRIFRLTKTNRRKFSYMFKTWEDGMAATREMMQCEAGFASVFRLSDAEETDVMMRLYNVDESPLAPLFKLRGMIPMQRSLFLGWSEGEKGFARNVAKNIHRIARKHGGMNLTSIVTSAWEHGRFTDPYLRDSMQDFGILTDTLECSVLWSNMEKVHQNVREYCKSRPNTIVTTHLSHAYPQGANLYFIFITKMNDIKDYIAYHSGILDAIQASGASMSHHHGIGKMFGPWLEGSLGKTEYSVFKALKHHFDPDNIMNPGGTLGFDIEANKLRFPKNK